MSCDGCAGAGTTRSGKACDRCRNTRPRQIKLNQLAARYVVALLEQLGAKAAPVTDCAPAARRWFETYRAHELASAGGCDAAEPWSLVAYPVASCLSASSTKQTTPPVAGS
jgi:hypothetical protein